MTLPDPTPVIPVFLHYRDPDDHARAVCGAPVFSGAYGHQGNHVADYLDVTCPDCVAVLLGNLEAR